MDEEVKQAIQEFLDEVERFAASGRNISMRDYKESPTVAKLRRLHEAATVRRVTFQSP